MIASLTQPPLLSVLLLLLLLLQRPPIASGLLTVMPTNAVLHAPWTPFTSTGALNLSVVPALAADAAAGGCNVVWCSGGMGQFDTLTLAERKAVAEAWMSAAASLDLFVIVHVGTTVQADAIELARHAASIGASGIGAVPPYYSKPSGPAGVAAWMAPVAAAAPSTPFFYYHIPGATGVSISMLALFPAALAAIPSFAGVKYVSGDLADFAALQAAYGRVVPSLALMFAPEPKLAGVGLGARGVVLAESFFAPTWLRMCHAVLANNWAAARAEQQWKMRIADIFSSFAGDGERTVYRATIGVDMGPPRAPSTPLAEGDYSALIAQLRAAGFFNQSAGGGPCVLP